MDRYLILLHHPLQILSKFSANPHVSRCKAPRGNQNLRERLRRAGAIRDDPGDFQQLAGHFAGPLVLGRAGFIEVWLWETENECMGWIIRSAGRPHLQSQRSDFRRRHGHENLAAGQSLEDLIGRLQGLSIDRQLPPIRLSEHEGPHADVKALPLYVPVEIPQQYPPEQPLRIRDPVSPSGAGPQSPNHASAASISPADGDRIVLRVAT